MIHLTLKLFFAIASGIIINIFFGLILSPVILSRLSSDNILYFLIISLIVSGSVSFFLAFFIIIKPLNIITARMRESIYSEPSLFTSIDTELLRSVETTDTLKNLFLILSRLVKQLSGEKKSLEHALSELQQAQEKLIQSQKLSILGQFATGIAHEIGNPLAALLGCVSVIKNSQLSDRDADLVVRIENELKRIDAIIHDLLQIARPSQIIINEYSSYDIFQEVIEFVQFQNGFQNIHITLIKSEQFPKILVDKDRIKQVILNLLSNAQQVMNEKGSITITSQTLINQALARFFITDTGNGIDKSILKKIFEPFNTSKSNGAGLGLSICKTIIEQHHGKIWVEKTDRNGTTFGIEVPLVPLKS